MATRVDRAGIDRRRGAGFIALGVCVGTATALCVPTGVGPATAADCSSKGAVVIVAGTNDPDGLVMKGVETKYRNEGYDVAYAKYPTTLWPAGSVGYNDDVSRGKAATGKAITDYRGSGGANCADAPVKVVGYSQGARVAGDVLSDIGNGRKVDVNNTPDDPTDDVLIDDENVSGELYSDPRQVGSIDGRGIELSLIGVIPGLTMTGPREGGFGSLSGDVVSVCDQGDPICDLPDPIRDPIGALDGLLGYFTKHGLYPAGFASQSPAEWADGNCASKGSGGTVCIKKDDSAFIGLVKQFAAQLGIPAATVNGIPDIVDYRPRIPGDVLPGLTISKLQPLIRLVQDNLPQLPNLTYHAGGYLPDVFVFQDIAEGILRLDGARFVRGSTALAKSIVSIVLIPVNGTVYWANRLKNAIGPQPVTTAATPMTTLASTGPDSTSAPKAGTAAKFKNSVDNTLASLTKGWKSTTAAPVVEASPPNSDDTTDAPGTARTTSATDGNDNGDKTTQPAIVPSPAASNPEPSDDDSGSDATVPGKKSRQHNPFVQPWNRGGTGDDDDTAAPSAPKWRSPFGSRNKPKSNGDGAQGDSSTSPGASTSGDESGDAGAGSGARTDGAGSGSGGGEGAGGGE